MYRSVILYNIQYCNIEPNHPKEKEKQEGKVVIEEALQIVEKRREVKSKGKRERYIQLNTEFQERASLVAQLVKNWPAVQET